MPAELDMPADWGRVGAEDSLFNPYTVALCESAGMCCSDLQRADLPANFDYSDVLGARCTCIRLHQHATKLVCGCMARGQITGPVRVGRHVLLGHAAC